MHKLLDDFVLNDDEVDILLKINELYIDSRYPGDMGLPPYGNPTIKDAKEFYDFAKLVFDRVCNTLDVNIDEVK